MASVTDVRLAFTFVAVFTLLVREADAQSCPAPVAPGNGSVSYGALAVGSTATYACDVGYILTGTTISTCLTSLLWDYPTPTCTIVDCQVLLAPLNGNVTNPDAHYYNDVAYYSCNPGYSMTGFSNRTCQANGVWSDDVAWCSPHVCPAPAQPFYGTVTCPTLLADSQCTFTCFFGYFMTGPSVVTCQTDGTWDWPSPTCSPIDCGLLPDITGGTLSYPVSTLFGNIVIYACDPGFVLSGGSSRTCLESGQWSDPEPVCVTGECIMPGSPPNGLVTCETLAAGGRCMFRCGPGYTRIGPSEITCLAGNIWDSPPPTCNLTSSLPCTTQWSSPVDQSMLIVRTPLPSFSALTAKSVPSYIHCVNMCLAHARLTCASGSECSLAMYNSTSGLCTTYVLDSTNGTTVDCTPASPCYRRPV